MHPFLLHGLLVPVELGLIFKDVQSDVVSAVHEGHCVLGSSYARTRETSLCLSRDVHGFCSQGGMFAFSFDALDCILQK